jgi:hypothetical protein
LLCSLWGAASLVLDTKKSDFSENILLKKGKELLEKKRSIGRASPHTSENIHVEHQHNRIFFFH